MHGAWRITGAQGHLLSEWMKQMGQMTTRDHTACSGRNSNAGLCDQDVSFPSMPFSGPLSPLCERGGITQQFSFLLRSNSHNKINYQPSSVNNSVPFNTFTMSYNHHPYLVPKFFITQNRNPVAIHSHSHYPLFPAPGNHWSKFYLFRFTYSWSFIYKQNLTIYDLWRLDSCIYHNVFEVHPCCISASFLFMANNTPWYRQTAWCSSAHPLMDNGLFPTSDDCEWCCCEHACLCIYSYFQFFWEWNCWAI